MMRWLAAMVWWPVVVATIVVESILLVVIGIPYACLMAPLWLFQWADKKMGENGRYW